MKLVGRLKEEQIRNNEDRPFCCYGEITSGMSRSAEPFTNYCFPLPSCVVALCFPTFCADPAPAWLSACSFTCSTSTPALMHDGKLEHWTHSARGDFTMHRDLQRNQSLHKVIYTFVHSNLQGLFYCIINVSHNCTRI